MRLSLARWMESGDNELGEVEAKARSHEQLVSSEGRRQQGNHMEWDWRALCGTKLSWMRGRRNKWDLIQSSKREKTENYCKEKRRLVAKRHGKQTGRLLAMYFLTSSSLSAVSLFLNWACDVWIVLHAYYVLWNYSCFYCVCVCITCSSMLGCRDFVTWTVSTSLFVLSESVFGWNNYLTRDCRTWAIDLSHCLCWCETQKGMVNQHLLPWPC